MAHELRELEARILKMDRAIQGFSVAKTLLPVIHMPGGITQAELLMARKTLDDMERHIAELAEMMRRLVPPSHLRVPPMRVNLYR